MYGQIAIGLMSLYAGYMGAQGKKDGALAQADEYDTLALETDITKKFNADQRNYVTEQYKLRSLQAGLNKAGMAGIQGLQTVENMRSEGGSSGAALGAGTPNEKIINQHIQNSSTQLAIMQGTKEKLDNIQQNAVAVNQMEDFKAEMRIKQLQRAADSARSGADSAFFASMIGTTANAGANYMSAGGDFSDNPDTGIYDWIFS